MLATLMLIGVAVSPTGSSALLATTGSRPAAQGQADDWVPIGFYGRVVALTPQTVTVKPEGNLTATLTWRSLDGTEHKKVYVQDNTKPPREFTFSEMLKPGPNGVGGAAYGHRVSDVQVGDVVHISCTRTRGVDYCRAIEIYRRPGGQVPPAVGETDVSPEHRWSVRMNAEQAREELGLAALRKVGLRFLR